MRTDKAVTRGNISTQDGLNKSGRSESGSSLPPLEVNADRHRTYAQMERWIRRRSNGQTLRILEAGCGSRWPLKLEGVPFALTAVDVDEHALEIRKTRVRDVDAVHVGDLRTSDLFAPASFDVIYNSFVLEHVDDAARVMDNFMRWLAPGGLLILRVPDGDSVYGFVTRWTPFWAHVLYKKYVQGIADAGKPGHDPYPVHYHPIVSRRGIHRYCNEHGCKVQYENGFSGYLPKSLFVGALAKTFVKSVSALSFGRFDWRYNNLTLVIEK